MNSSQNSKSWTDPITGEVYTSEPAVPKSTGVPLRKEQSDVMPPPNPARNTANAVPTPVPRPAVTPNAVPAPVPRGVVRFCEHCGGVLDAGATVCPCCGGSAAGAPAVTPSAQPIVINNNVFVNSPNNNINNLNNYVTQDPSKQRNKWVAFVLCLFMGYFGAHKFYDGKLGIGLVYFFTFGLFGLGWFIDIFRILAKPNPYYVN